MSKQDAKYQDLESALSFQQTGSDRNQAGAIRTSSAKTNVVEPHPPAPPPTPGPTPKPKTLRHT